MRSNYFVRCIAMILLPFVGYAAQPGFTAPAQKLNKPPETKIIENGWGIFMVSERK